MKTLSALFQLTLPVLLVAAQLLFLVAAQPAHAFLDEDVSIQFRAPESGTIEDLSKKVSQPIQGEVEMQLRLTAPSLVSLKGRIPVLLVPVQPGISQVTLNPPTTKSLIAEPTQKEVSREVTEVMMAITTIQKAIQKRDVETASVRLDDLRKKYPDVEFLEFVRASLLVLKGQKSEARRAVSRALEAHPDYKEGQEFLKALGGAEAK